MVQAAPKKSPAPQTAAKLATAATGAVSDVANKMSQTAYSAAESTRKGAYSVVNIGSTAARDMLSSGAGEIQKAQEKMHEIGRESAQNFARSADMATKALVECIGISRDNIDAAMECGNITAEMAKTVSQEAYEYCNRAFSDCVELSKEAFTCRTINDMVELQNRAFRQWMDSCFGECAKMSNLMFEYASDAIEPINERVADSTEQMSKVFAG
jgi:hypothetical protein